MLNKLIAKEQQQLEKLLTESQETAATIELQNGYIMEQAKKSLVSPQGLIGCFAVGFLTDKVKCPETGKASNSADFTSLLPILLSHIH